MADNNYMQKAVNVGHMNMLKGYSDKTFATKKELEQATGSAIEPANSATSMWQNYEV